MKDSVLGAPEHNAGRWGLGTAVDLLLVCYSTLLSFLCMATGSASDTLPADFDLWPLCLMSIFSYSTTLSPSTKYSTSAPGKGKASVTGL